MPLVRISLYAFVVSIAYALLVRPLWPKCIDGGHRWLRSLLVAEAMHQVVLFKALSGCLWYVTLLVNRWARTGASRAMPG